LPDLPYHPQSLPRLPSIHGVIVDTSRPPTLLSYLEGGEADEALEVLTAGIAKAKARGDWHAAAEMEGLIDLLG
jgi:hypothetical protein